MALNNNDLLVVQQNSTGELRKVSIQKLFANSPASPNLQAVTNSGDSTTNGATFGNNVIVGQKIFGASATNVGVEANAADGALYISAGNNNAVSALEVQSSVSQASHLKVLGSGDLKIGSNVSSAATTSIELNPNGSGTFATGNIALNTDGSIDAVSIDCGEY